jgi:hypothetical protein
MEEMLKIFQIIVPSTAPITRFVVAGWSAVTMDLAWSLNEPWRPGRPCQHRQKHYAADVRPL